MLRLSATELSYLTRFTWIRPSDVVNVGKMCGGFALYAVHVLRVTKEIYLNTEHEWKPSTDLTNTTLGETTDT